VREGVSHRGDFRDPGNAEGERSGLFRVWPVPRSVSHGGHPLEVPGDRGKMAESSRSQKGGAYTRVFRTAEDPPTAGPWKKRSSRAEAAVRDFEKESRGDRQKNRKPLSSQGYTLFRVAPPMNRGRLALLNGNGIRSWSRKFSSKRFLFGSIFGLPGIVRVDRVECV
jgi:hypothetical protein